MAADWFSVYKLRGSALLLTCFCYFEVLRFIENAVDDAQFCTGCESCGTCSDALPSLERQYAVVAVGAEWVGIQSEYISDSRSLCSFNGLSIPILNVFCVHSILELQFPSVYSSSNSTSNKKALSS